MERLVVTEVAGKGERTFEFHPDDLPDLKDACCDWVGSRYLLFGGTRLALIDS